MKSAPDTRSALPRIETHDCAFSVPAEARIAANDEAQRQAERDSEPLGPMWLIAIAMTAFFAVTGLVMALG